MDIENNELESDRTLARCTEALTSLGNHAGRSGAAASIPESLVNAFAERHVQRHWNGKRKELAKRRTSADCKAAESALAREQFDRSSMLATRLEADRHAHPHRFSIWLALFLFIPISLLLFFSDFPLSLLLVGDIFQLPIKGLGQPLSHLFSNLGRQSWQVMFLGFGIAFFPLVLKIPYQYFVSHAEVDKEKGGFWRWFVHSVMGVVLLLTVVTLFLLAIVRENLYASKMQTADRESQQELLETKQQTGVRTQQPDMDAPPAEPTGFIFTCCFVFLTLTLPILATVAFSEGAGALQRNWQFRSAKRHLQQLKKAHTEALGAEIVAREDVKTIEDSMRSPEAVEAWREIARQKGISLYLAAHEEGRRAWIEEFKNRSLYETMVLSAGEELSPPTGNAFCNIQGDFLQ